LHFNGVAGWKLPGKICRCIKPHDLAEREFKESMLGSGVVFLEIPW
jgi:hypothetical protein